VSKHDSVHDVSLMQPLKRESHVYLEVTPPTDVMTVVEGPALELPPRVDSRLDGSAAFFSTVLTRARTLPNVFLSLGAGAPGCVGELMMVLLVVSSRCVVVVVVVVVGSGDGGDDVGSSRHAMQRESAGPREVGWLCRREDELRQGGRLW